MAKNYNVFKDHANATSVEDDIEDGRDPIGLRTVSLDDLGGDIEDDEGKDDGEVRERRAELAEAKIERLREVLTEQEYWLLMFAHDGGDDCGKPIFARVVNSPWARHLGVRNAREAKERYAAIVAKLRAAGLSL